MSVTVWLDLEETIIDSWSSGVLINTHKIKKWLDDHNVSLISIWSFAIWNEVDQQEFVSSGMKSAIEQALHRPIVSAPSILNMKEYVYDYERIHYDDGCDFMTMNGKHWSFIKFCMGRWPGTHCVLIDDCVPSWTIKDNATGGVIELINILDI
jgi:hypothetical protein